MDAHTAVSRLCNALSEERSRVTRHATGYGDATVATDAALHDLCLVADRAPEPAQTDAPQPERAPWQWHPHTDYQPFRTLEHRLLHGDDGRA